MPRPHAKRKRKPAKDGHGGQVLFCPVGGPPASGEAPEVGRYAKTRRAPLGAQGNASKLKSMAFQSAASILRWKSSRVVQLVDSSDDDGWSSDEEQQPVLPDSHPGLGQGHHSGLQPGAAAAGGTAGERRQADHEVDAPWHAHRRRQSAMGAQQSKNSGTVSRAAGSRQRGASTQSCALSISRVSDSQEQLGSSCLGTSCCTSKEKENLVQSMGTALDWGGGISSPCSPVCEGLESLERDVQQLPYAARDLPAHHDVSLRKYSPSRPGRHPLLPSLADNEGTGYSCRRHDGWRSPRAVSRPRQKCGLDVLMGTELPPWQEVPEENGDSGTREESSVAPALFPSSKALFLADPEMGSMPAERYPSRPIATRHGRRAAAGGLFECLSKQQQEECQGSVGIPMAPSSLSSPIHTAVSPQAWPVLDYTGSPPERLLPAGTAGGGAVSHANGLPIPLLQAPTADAGLLQGVWEADENDSARRYEALSLVTSSQDMHRHNAHSFSTGDM